MFAFLVLTDDGITLPRSLAAPARVVRVQEPGVGKAVIGLAYEERVVRGRHPSTDDGPAVAGTRTMDQGILCFAPAAYC